MLLLPPHPNLLQPTSTPGVLWSSTLGPTTLLYILTFQQLTFPFFPPTQPLLVIFPKLAKRIAISVVILKVKEKCEESQLRIL